MLYFTVIRFFISISLLICYRKAYDTLRSFLKIHRVKIGICKKTLNFANIFNALKLIANLARTCSFINYLSPTLFVGRCCCENIKNGVIRWRKVGLFRRSRHDEKIWSQKYCQITRSLHSDWACLYSYGIHALWRFENISSCKVINHNMCFHFIVLTKRMSNFYIIMVILKIKLCNIRNIHQNIRHK